MDVVGREGRGGRMYSRIVGDKTEIKRIMHDGLHPYC